MRKSGADMGASITGVFSILICVVVPPAQLAAVIIPSTIAFAVSSVRRRREVELESEGGRPIPVAG
jgi:hypothetical protein